MAGRNWANVRRRAAKTAKRLFEDFDGKRRQILTDVCREFYPLGVAGLVKTTEDVADECWYDEEHRLLTCQPLVAVRNGACGFKSHLTPNAGGWFKFKPVGADGDAAVDGEAMDRLTTAVERAFDRSRAYDSLYKLYEHLLVAGFGCLLVTRHPRDVVRVRTLRLGTYAMGVDGEGDVVRVARRFSWTADQILGSFGADGAPERVRDAARKGDLQTRWTVWNLVEPNATGDMRAYDETARELALDDSMVYRSVYWIEGARDDDPQGGVLDASGFTVKPIVAPRLDRELGDVYGRGRGIDALCAARGAQSFQYDILGVSGIRGKPPLVVSSEFKDDGFRAGRGGINYVRFGEQRGALAYPVFAQLPDTADLRVNRQDAEQQISELFFNSSFATIDALKNNPGVKTATEVDNLVRENMERLAPIVMNLERELLDPLVTAVARYAVAAGFAPLTKEDVEAISDVEVEYVSRLHMAAHARRVSDIDAWTARLGQLAALKPEVLDKVDADAVADEYAEMLGVPASVRAKDADVAAIRQERERQAQMQQQAAAMQQMGELAKIGSVPTDGEHLGGMLKDAQENGGEA
ncbi:MAG: hypothetical protein IKL96_02660 [Kiritimatiellae bacterium]|nr:hypothetical protein [Kiritimatiellia bacterium]